MATISLNIPGFAYTDTSIPIPKNDIIANDGTVDIFDALEPDVSWPKQADPEEGVDTWKSLIGSNTASFSGTVGWSDGFTIDAGADTINMPSSFKWAADGSGVAVIWIIIGTQAHTTGNGLIAWLGDNDATAQISIWLEHGASDAERFIKGFTPKTEATIMAAWRPTLPANGLVQPAVSAQPEGAGYRIKGFVNNALTYNTLRTGLTAMPTPTANLKLGGTRPGFTNAFTGKILRAAFDDLSETTAEEFVTLDYETHLARLTP